MRGGSRAALRDPADLPEPAAGVGSDRRDEERVMGDEMSTSSMATRSWSATQRGDIEASPTDPTGLFSFDTRFLSKWLLTVNGDRLTSLSTDDLQYFEARFFLVPGSAVSTWTPRSR